MHPSNDSTNEKPSLATTTSSTNPQQSSVTPIDVGTEPSGNNDIQHDSKIPATRSSNDDNDPIYQDTDTVTASNGGENPSSVTLDDPLELARHRRANVSRKQMAIDHPSGNKRKLKKFYSRQNDLIDQFLNSSDEERLAVLDAEKNGPRVKIAVYGSSGVNLFLFVIQLYAAISTGSLSLFATAADAFMDLVSSAVMLFTSRLSKRPSIYKYPVGRTRIETMGIIMFCALMTTVAVELIVESARALAAGAGDDKPLKIVPLIFVGVALFCKSCMFVYCFLLRRYPAARIFMLDHRNDIIVNAFGLIMSIIGDRFVWWLDPMGAILIGMLILLSWVSTAFEHVWLLVGKGAPKEFISKVVYVTITHDKRILKVDTCRAYHAGEKYYVEVDVIMDENLPLKITHDVGQTLQRKIEGLEDVERAFVHVDYEDEHDVTEEHKPLYEANVKRKSFRDIFSGKKKTEEAAI
ncbi:hypothetical protein BT63DRAFT_380211 [Microthyrium microscopicum]|uniref:Uncharacterized protein n=1 Tax=Microthyrium microscopicum TaxID=703497 RepID=A0A6A6TVF5_9PEZI|nr:hypothetical protein BT63DRAFT_380211 [Microthyrium microscopicum]